MEMLVGREAEKKILENRLNSGSPELVAIYGRRRVGKTFLVRNFFKEHLVFEMTGIHNATFREQLRNFSIVLQKALNTPVKPEPPSSWQEAFAQLDLYLDTKSVKKPTVIFFDEFPWINSRKSGFLQGFDHWWNSSANKRNNLKVIICGSAASWMIENIIHDRGGLYNRVTQHIRLDPFTLAESEAFFRARAVKLDQYQVLQLYMALGGIPHYLGHVHTGESAAQAIDRLCFAKNGILTKEFSSLYKSLFDHAEHHTEIVRTLARNGKGLTRNEIIRICKLSTGGTTTKILRELEESGFISSYIPFNKTKKDSVYKLTDEYSLFYLKFIEGARATGSGTWLRQFTTQSYKSWSGFAFESVCKKHIPQIKNALGIGSVLTEESTWRHLPVGKSDTGVQIDLLLDRADRVINVCEMKFTTTEFSIDKKYARELDTKLNVFQRESRTRKVIHLVMITTYGVEQNIHYTGRVQNEIRMVDLFK